MHSSSRSRLGDGFACLCNGIVAALLIATFPRVSCTRIGLVSLSLCISESLFEPLSFCLRCGCLLDLSQQRSVHSTASAALCASSALVTAAAVAAFSPSTLVSATAAFFSAVAALPSAAARADSAVAALPSAAVVDHLKKVLGSTWAEASVARPQNRSRLVNPKLSPKPWVSRDRKVGANGGQDFDRWLRVHLDGKVTWM